MVRYICIRPVHNIGKKLVNTLKGAQADLNLSCFNDNLHIVSIALFWRVSQYNCASEFRGRSSVGPDPPKQRRSSILVKVVICGNYINLNKIIQI